MKLLHTEIDIVPGRRPLQPTAEGMIGPGSATLRLQNTTNQENAYTIRLRCENPYWQEDWYSLQAVPAGASPDGSVVTSKADQYGPKNRWVKVFVSRGGTRDVIISFNLPQTPDSRAGVYPFVVSIETHLTEPGGLSRNRFTELSATAIVRPYYRWNLDMAPEECRVGILRRTSEFDVVVTNEGNDWLYCDLALPRSKDLMLEAPTMRIAVPPPEPGEANCQRTVPLRSTTRLKVLRGAQTPQKIPLTAARIDAPTVPPLPEDLVYSAGSANLGSAVVAAPTGEVAQIPTDRVLTYCPPVPTTVTGFFGALVQNGKTLLLSLLALAALVPFVTVGWERLRYSGVLAKPDPTNLYVEPEGKLGIQGSHLVGAVILIKAGDKVAEVKPRVTQLTPFDRQRAEIEIPKDIDGLELKDGRKIRLAAQRLGVLPFLRPLLPRSEFSRAEVTVGKAPVVVVPVEERFATTGGRVKAGDHFRIAFTGGPALPAGRAPQVLLGGAEASVAQWNPRKLVAVVPDDAPEGSLPVEIVPSDGGKVTVKGNIEVVLDIAHEEHEEEGPGGGSDTGGATGGGGTGGGTTGGGATGGGGTGGGTTGGGGPIVEPPIKKPPVVRPPRLSTAELGYNDLLGRKYDSALKRANSILARNPNDALALAIKGYALTRLGRDRDAAIDALQNAARLTTGKKGRARSIALTGYGAILANAGNIEKAREYFREAKAADPTMDVVYDAEAAAEGGR